MRTTQTSLGSIARKTLAGIVLGVSILGLSSCSQRKRVEIVTYDSSYEILRIEWCYNNDIYDNIDTIFSYSPGSKGRVISGEVDYGTNILVHKIYNYTLDSTGRVINGEVNDYVNRIVRFNNTFDSTGRIKSERYSKEIKHIYTLDSAGRVIRNESDYENNGVIDYMVNYTLDSEGRVIKAEEWENNKIVKTLSYTRDSTGKIITERITWEYFDDPDRVYLQEYSEELRTFDSVGRVKRGEVDDDSDGVIDRVNIYDSTGTVIKTEGDVCVCQ